MSRRPISVDLGGDLSIPLNVERAKSKGGLKELHELLADEHRRAGVTDAEAKERATDDVAKLLHAAFLDVAGHYVGTKSTSIDRLLRLQQESLSFYDDLLRTRSTPDLKRLETLFKDMEVEFNNLRKATKDVIPEAPPKAMRAEAEAALGAETAAQRPQAPSAPDRQRLETLAKQRGIELDDLVDLATGDVSRADLNALLTLAQRSDATKIALLANELEKFGIPFRSDMLKHFPEGGDFDAGLAALRKDLYAKGLHAETVTQPAVTSPGAKSPETGLTSPSPLEQDVLDALDINDLQQTRPTPGGQRLDVSTEAGQLVHTVRGDVRYAEALREQLGNAPVPGQFADDVQAGRIITLDKLPDRLLAEETLGITSRVDRITRVVDEATGIIYELKPNTENSIKKGFNQGQGYANLVNSQRRGGRTDWRAVVVVYDAAKARAFVPPR